MFGLGQEPVVGTNLRVLLLMVASVLAQAMPGRGQTLDAAFQSDINLKRPTGSAASCPL